MNQIDWCKSVDIFGQGPKELRVGVGWHQVWGDDKLLILIQRLKSVLDGTSKIWKDSASTGETGAGSKASTPNKLTLRRSGESYNEWNPSNTMPCF
jgi:hypothetical protein